MKTTLTEQQKSFFTKNGYIELSGIPYDRAKTLAHSPSFLEGRDLWRKDPHLHTLLTRKLAPLAFDLTSRQQLRLAGDQWIPADYRIQKATPLQELFDVQGLAIAFVIGSECSTVERKSPLGIIPLPSTPDSILFFLPHLILDWPHLPPTDLYFGIYALPNARYIQNPKDPLTNHLKSIGYGFGDALKNEFHPLLTRH